MWNRLAAVVFTLAVFFVVAKIIQSQAADARKAEAVVVDQPAFDAGKSLGLELGVYARSQGMGAPTEEGLAALATTRVKSTGLTAASRDWWLAGFVAGYRMGFGTP